MLSGSTVILSARRTPVGAFQGVFAQVTGVQLGAVAIKAALMESKLVPSVIDEVIMGCVLSAGIGQAPARQAAIGGGVPSSVPATTVNKMCGSGMKAVMLAADQILAGSARAIIAGGFESMSNAPYLLQKARAGYRMGHQEVLDHMIFDGLQSPWDGKHMGCFADATAAKYEITREMQDTYAAASVGRAQAAVTIGDFVPEIAPVLAKLRRSESLIDTDETPMTLDAKKIPSLKAAFGKTGTVTAASSASISDGAAALVLASEAFATSQGVKPIARILGYTSYACEPEWFTLAPIGAIRKLLSSLCWQPRDVDLYEINEAFAIVSMVSMRELSLDHSHVNVNGGACALGHPIGATGARLLTTLIHALIRRGQKRGIASLCIGGGEATAIAVEIC